MLGYVKRMYAMHVFLVKIFHFGCLLYSEEHVYFILFNVIIFAKDEKRNELAITYKTFFLFIIFNGNYRKI